MPASPITYAGRLASNALLGDAEWARAHLRPHAGKSVHVSAWPWPGSTLRVSADGDLEDAQGVAGADADVRVRLGPATLPRWAMNVDKPGGALDGDGDPALLQALRDVADVAPLA